MKYGVLALFLALAGASCLNAQFALDGFYASVGGSTDLVGGDIGFWTPVPNFVPDGGNKQGGLAVRLGIEIGQETRNHKTEARLHGDIGPIAGEQFYTLLGLLWATGNSQRSSGVGIRVSPGIYISDHLSLEAFWEGITSHPSAVGGQLTVTFR